MANSKWPLNYKQLIMSSLLKEFRLSGVPSIELVSFSKSINEGLLGAQFAIQTSECCLNGVIYPDEEAATVTYEEIVRNWILNGVFFKEVIVGIEIYREISKVCNTRDLRKWLEVVSLSGCLSDREQKDENLQVIVVDNENALSNARKKFIEGLDEAEEHIFDSVLSLTSSPVEATKVLMDHCSFDNRELEAAIVRGCGGWAHLSPFGGTVKTSEGYLIEPSDEFTFEYIKRLY